MNVGEIRRRGASRSRGRGTHLGALGIGIAVTAMVLLAASGVGTASRSLSIAAPYKGSTYAGSDVVGPLLPGSCSSAVLARHSAWHSSTGTGGWAEQVSVTGVRGCNGPNSTVVNDYAVADSLLYIAIPVGSPTSSGIHSVLANWTVNVTAAWASTHGPCPRVILVKGNGAQRCEVDTHFYFYTPGAALEDLNSGLFVASLTTHAYINNGSTWFHDSTCSANSCSIYVSHTGVPSGRASLNSAGHSYWNSTWMNSTDKYAVVFTLQGGVSATCISYPQPLNCPASASLNVGTRGNQWTLNSIIIQ